MEKNECNITYMSINNKIIFEKPQNLILVTKYLLLNYINNNTYFSIRY